MSGTNPRRRHGLAGLLVILFVVGGLIFSYGLGHAPVARVCTAHAVSAPAGAVLSLSTPSSLGTPAPSDAPGPFGSPPAATLSAGAAPALGAVSGGGARQAAGTGLSLLQGLQKPAGAALAALAAPLKDKPRGIPPDTCLCLAVLLLLLLGLAAGRRRRAFRLPARVGWAVVPLPAGAPVRPSRHSLQVLRL
ncbi:hypothetical protein ACN3XK_34975 [Actinomadura welshii]